MHKVPPLCNIFQALNLPNCRNVALTLLGYLGNEDIENVSKAFEMVKCQNYFVSLVQNYNFIANYINRTDKSLYFTFYGEEEYQKMQISKVASVAQSNSNLFLKYHKDITRVMQTLQKEVPVIGAQLDVLNNLIVDPDLPLPKLKRETEGMYCSSPFQLFLIDTTYRQEDEQFFTCFQKLQEFLSAEKEEEYLKQFMAILKDKHTMGSQLKKIMKIRYTPYEVNAQNFQDFLMENNQLHNFIVALFALTDIMIEATHTYISQIHDPLQRLIELLLRYSIFRNYVLGIQEYLSFAFNMYENVYHQSIQEDPKKPKYKFWRPALTKWFLKMNYLHSESMEVYMHCLTKIRKNNLLEKLGQLCNNDQFHYGKIFNQIQLNNYEFNLAAKIFDGQLNTSSQIGLFFDVHPQNYQVIVMQFNEYLIDISINEQTVHWCGHSAHQLQQPYLTYEQQFLNMNRQYVQSLIGPGLQKKDVHTLVSIDIQYLSILQIKNRTLKKVVDCLQTELELDGEHALIFDFDEADHKLQYFNKKALIMAEVEKDERPFYSIPPHCSADELIGMIDTNDSQNCNENDQYRSQASDDDKKYSKSNNFNFEELEEETVKESAKKQPKSNKHFLQDESSLSNESETEYSPFISLQKN